MVHAIKGFVPPHELERDLLIVDNARDEGEAIESLETMTVGPARAAGVRVVHLR